MLPGMTQPEEVWIPLVDEPIGTIVSQVQEEHPEIGRLVAGQQQQLAFKTFAYIRVGVLLGELLVDNDIDPYNGSKTWIEELLANPAHKQRVVDEVQAVAEEVARDESAEQSLGPDDAARERFRQFAKRQREDAS